MDFPRPRGWTNPEISLFQNETDWQPFPEELRPVGSFHWHELGDRANPLCWRAYCREPSSDLFLDVSRNVSGSIGSHSRHLKRRTGCRRYLVPLFAQEMVEPGADDL